MPTQAPPADHKSGQANKPLSAPAHALPYRDLIDQLNANPEDGLKAAEASQRLDEYGSNEFGEAGGVNIGKILLRQVANAMTLVLILAMAVSFGIQSYIEGGVLAGIILLNVAIGFYQEFRAEKTMDSLRSLSSPTANTVRDGSTTAIPTREVVPGDMVELKTGDTVPADVRLVEAVNFETDEALLTGESLPVAKDAEQTFDDETGPGDRLNVAYSSSVVTKGRARGIVFATGSFTEVGAIAAALNSTSSRRAEVKRRADGSAGPHRYVEAWVKTAGMAVGMFLGVNVGTPLQRKLSRLAVLLFGVAVICAIIVLAANNFAQYPDLANSNPEQEVAIYAVATGVSMIPASLTVILTITMAAGTRVMVKRNVIVRKLNALEALGGVTDICSDKTGTLTQGKMVAKRAWIPSRGTYAVGESSQPFNPTDGDLLHVDESPAELDQKTLENSAAYSREDLLKDNEPLTNYLKVASLANLAHVHNTEGEWKARGDPTEIAIQVFACRFDWNRGPKTPGDKPQWRQLAEFPFDSDVKRMSVIFEETSSGSISVFTKGAVERIVDQCTTALWSEKDGLTDFTSAMKDEVAKNVEAISSLGLRCLALASKPLKSYSPDSKMDRAEVENDLTFHGLIGLYDPPRPESAGAVRRCHQAGVAVHMLTGDHVGTAKAIAQQVGILPSKTKMLSKPVADAMVMTASQFDALSDSEIDNLPVLPLVVARCAPNTKVRMIDALHRRSKFAAMTGDGVNDSPSLKKADVGIAMGQAGSDVAKDASDIILTDDNFASILNAVEEGRRMFDNIRSFVLHLLAQNVGGALTLLVGLAFKDERNLSVFPLSPVEILWIIMVTSGIPDMGLGFEPAKPDVMARPPADLKAGIFSWEIVLDMMVYGIWMAALSLGAFSLRIYGFADGAARGDLGDACNQGYSARCDSVFRARGTTFSCFAWFSVLLAWQMIDLRRSMFRMAPQTDRPWTQWMRDLWRNQMLFWAVVGAFLLTFPVLYIPVINHAVFVHTGLTWEWGIVFVATFIFLLGCESYKWGKRVYFRHAGSDARAAWKSGSAEDRTFGMFERTLSDDSGLSVSAEKKVLGEKA